jgi:hypothetical protein
MVIRPRGSVTMPRPAKSGVGLLLWCKEVNRALQQLRDRVFEAGKVSSGGGGGAVGYIPWEPQFSTTGTEPSIVYKCTFNLGTVNNVAATNWDDEFTLPTDATIKFVVLTITTASGKVTGVSISIDAAPPTDDVIAKDTPPVTHYIVLGAIGKDSAQMIVTTNLQENAVEVFRETVAAPATGAEPFSRWWRWEVQ